MSAHSIDTNAVIDGMAGRTANKTAGLIGIVGIVLGVVGFALGLLVFKEPSWTWGAYIAGLVFILGIAQGGVIFSVIMTATHARWGRPLKRIAETFGLFLPFGYLALIVLLVVGLKVYPWHPQTWSPNGPVDLAPHSGLAIDTKAMWLDPTFFMLRQLGAVGFLFILDFFYLRGSFGPDLIMAGARLKSQDASWKAPGWWSILGYKEGADQAAAIASGKKMQGALFPLIGLFYAVVFSLIAFDLVMSLAPWWYSNMFGAWFFASSFWISMAALGITAVLTKRWLGINHLITSNVTLDLGKLILAFCMFWAYTLFAQILPIWYANMPEETDFLLVRMTLGEWSWMSKTVAVMCFVMPFTVLVSRGIKKMEAPFVLILAVILMGVFMERTLLVMPSIWFESSFPIVLFLCVSLPIFAGFAGGFILLVSRVLAKVPPIPVSDPELGAHPWDVHVHAYEGDVLPASK